MVIKNNWVNRKCVQDSELSFGKILKYCIPVTCFTLNLSNLSITNNSHILTSWRLHCIILYSYIHQNVIILPVSFSNTVVTCKCHKLVTVSHNCRLWSNSNSKLKLGSVYYNFWGWASGVLGGCWWVTGVSNVAQYMFRHLTTCRTGDWLNSEMPRISVVKCLE